jgi:DNA-binding NtrC family response regulator
MAAPARVVLIVDDEPEILDVLQSALAHAGYVAIVADGPFDAIKKSRNTDGAIDLLLTDIVMPDMDGPELAQRLAAERPGLRVLLMSGYSRIRSNLPFLAKPFDVTQLLKRISDTIDGPPAFRSDTTGEKSSVRGVGPES